MLNAKINLIASTMQNLIWRIGLVTGFMSIILAVINVRADGEIPKLRVINGNKLSQKIAVVC